MLDGGEWRQCGLVNTHSALRAGIFKAWGSTDPMGVFGERRGTRLRAPVIVSMSPPGYPSAMVASLQCLLPFRLARSLYSGSGPTDAPPRAPHAAASTDARRVEGE